MTKVQNAKTNMAAPLKEVTYHRLHLVTDRTDSPGEAEGNKETQRQQKMRKLTCESLTLLCSLEQAWCFSRLCQQWLSWSLLTTTFHE